MKLYFTGPALKDLEKLPKETKDRILKKLSFFISQEEPLKYAKAMVNNDFGQYRFRIGDYRVIFDIKREEILVLVVDHRKDVYK